MADSRRQAVQAVPVAAHFTEAIRQKSTHGSGITRLKDSFPGSFRAGGTRSARARAVLVLGTRRAVPTSEGEAQSAALERAPEMRRVPTLGWIALDGRVRDRLLERLSPVPVMVEAFQTADIS